MASRAVSPPPRGCANLCIHPWILNRICFLRSPYYLKKSSFAVRISCCACQTSSSSLSILLRLGADSTPPIAAPGHVAWPGSFFYTRCTFHRKTKCRNSTGTATPPFPKSPEKVFFSRGVYIPTRPVYNVGGASNAKHTPERKRRGGKAEP